MRIDANGAYVAETPAEMRELIEMATGGGRGDIGRSSGMSPTETLMALGATYPGTNNLFGSNPIDIDLDTPAARVAPTKATGGLGALGAKLNAFRQGYEAGVTPLVRNQTAVIGKGVRGASKLMGFAPSAAGNAGRMAMQALNNPLMQTGMKYAPVVGSALAVGDLVFGDESLGNKAVDAAAMTAGGLLGSVVPVVGTGLGIAAGKMVSDGLQGIFGGTPKEQRLAEALSQLEGGRI